MVDELTIASRHVAPSVGMQGRNNQWTSLLTMGESWHNDHHAFPGSAKRALHAKEWDPGWWVLLGLRRLGLVWNCRLPENLPARAELRRIAGPAIGQAPVPKHWWQHRGTMPWSEYCPLYFRG